MFGHIGAHELEPPTKVPTRMNMSKIHSTTALVIALFGFGAASQARAENRVPGTKVFYSYQKDPMNDANLSIIFIDEVNDTGSNTYLSMKCAAGQGWLFGIATKHTLLPSSLSAEELDELADNQYTVSYRVGTSQPGSITDLTPAWFNGKLRPESLLFYGTSANNAIAQGLLDGKKIVIRIQPKTADAAIKRQLDYIFQPQGFSQAFTAVKRCK